MKRIQSFYARSTFFVVLSLTGAVINYALYPILSRILSLSQFGDYVTVISISNQVMGVLLAFSVLSIAFVKQFGESEANEKAQIVQKVLLWVFSGLSIITIILSPLLKNLLKIESIYSFLFLAIIMLVAVPANIWSGYLQGHKEQVRVGIFSVSTALLKFLAGVALAVVAGVNGGLVGFILGSTAGLFLLYYLPGKHVPKLNNIYSPLSAPGKEFIKSNWKYMLQAIFVVAGLVFLQNYDINRVKALFSPEVAGVYGGVSIISNGIYYVAFLLIWVLLPEFSLSKPANNRQILRTAYTLISLLALGVVLGGYLLGDWSLAFVLGSNFANQGTTLIVAALFQISLVSVSLYAFYLLILKKPGSTLLAGSVLACCLVIPPFFSSTPLTMITSLWGSTMLGAGIYALSSLFRKPVHSEL
ncbi:MAG: hypothetical protein ABIQ89_02420 [Candidatus Saccharimonadales bacterium]